MQYLPGPHRACPVEEVAPALLQYPLDTAPLHDEELLPPVPYLPAAHCLPEGRLVVDADGQ